MSVQNTKNYIGIDVSKAILDVHIRPSGKTLTVSNDSGGIETLIGHLRPLAPERVVMEATGGFEIPASAGLASAGLPVVVVNARQIRGFAVAVGRLAKTDPIDAAVISRFAETVCPDIRDIPDETEKELADLTVRRRQLVDMRTAEKNRLLRSEGKVRDSVGQMIAYLDEQISQIDNQILQTVESSPERKEKRDILESIPGIGGTISGVLIARLPELGKLGGRQIAALAGLAPFNNDSGKRQGRRHIYGGRAAVRSHLYMGTLSAIRYNPAIKKFYERLTNAGKAKKSAMTACARKLLVIANSMIKNNSLRDENYGKSA